MTKRIALFCLIVVCCACHVAAQTNKPQLMIPTGHPQGIVKLRLLQKRQIIVSQSYNESAVRFWDIRTNKLLRVLSLPQQPTDISINNNTEEILFNFIDSAALVYDIMKDAPSFKLPTAFDTAYYSPNSKNIVAVIKNNIHLFDASSGKLLNKQSSIDTITQFFPLANQKKYVSVTKKNNRLQYDVLDSSLKKIKRIYSSPVSKPAFILSYANNIGLFSFTDSSCIKFTFNKKLQLIERYKEDSVFGQPEQISLDRTTGLTAFAMTDTTVQVFNSKGHWKYWLNYFPSGIRGILFCNAGKNLLVKTAIEMMLYNASTGMELNMFNEDPTIIDTKNVEAGFCYDEKAKRFYFPLRDNFIYGCEAKDTSIVVHTKLKGLTKGVDKILSSNGLVTYGSGDGFIKQIDLGNATIKDFRYAHNGFLTALQEQDNIYLSSSWDSTIKVWDKNSFKLLHSKQLNDKVLDAFISKDSQVLATKGSLLDGDTSSLLLYHLSNPDKQQSIKLNKQGSVTAVLMQNKPVLAFIEDSTIQMLSDSLTEIKSVKSAGEVIGLSYRDGSLYATTTSSIEEYDSTLSLIKTTSFYNENGTGGFDVNSKNNTVLLGTKDGMLQYYSKDERKVRFQVKASNDATVPKFINDTSCITISESGIAKYWKIGNNAFTELCTIIPFENGEYITILPNGYYKGSKKGAASLHYVTKELKVIAFDQLDIRFNRPDKVLEAIGSTDSNLISSYKKAYDKRIKKMGFDTVHFTDGFNVPEAEFTNRSMISTEQKSNKLLLKIKASDKQLNLESFNLWVNDVPLFGLLGKRIKPSRTFDTSIIINLSTGENNIACAATNSNSAESYRMPLLVKYSPIKKTQPKFHFVGIGINQFANPEYNLNWSVKDIRDLAKKLKSKYANIIIDTLFDKNVTKQNILALKKKLLLLNEDDKVVVSYSGHGILSKDFDYYLATYNINFNQPETNGLAYDEMESLLDNIKPRQKLMLIDACHSGEVDKDEMQRIETAKEELNKNGITTKSTIKVVKKNLGLSSSFELMQSLFVNVGKGTGATIIGAAGGMQYAQERGDLKNGVFTYCLLEAFNQYKTLKVSDLRTMVSSRATQLTNGLQKPTSRNETNNHDWTIW